MENENLTEQERETLQKIIRYYTQRKQKSITAQDVKTIASILQKLHLQEF